MTEPLKPPSAHGRCLHSFFATPLVPDPERLPDCYKEEMHDPKDKPSASDHEASIALLRSQLQGLDAKLVRVLHQRIAVVRELAKTKRELGLPMRDDAQEARVKEQLIAQCELELASTSISPSTRLSTRKRATPETWPLVESIYELLFAFARGAPPTKEPHVPMQTAQGAHATEGKARTDGMPANSGKTGRPTRSSNKA
jgi:chorismate mutase